MEFNWGKNLRKKNAGIVQRPKLRSRMPNSLCVLSGWGFVRAVSTMSTGSTLIGASLYLAHSRYPGISHERQLAGKEAQNVFLTVGKEQKIQEEDTGHVQMVPFCS